MTGSISVKELSKAEEIAGKLAFQHLEDKFMHSVLDNDKKIIEKGKLLNDAISYGVGSFSPDLMFENLARNYYLAKQIYGESLIRLIAGYDLGYINRNIQIPEFRNKLRENIAKNIEELKEEGFIDKDCTMSEKGLELASLVLYFQELDNISAAGYIGENPHKKSSIYGEEREHRRFSKWYRYKDVAVKKSIRKAIRRGHKKIQAEDLQVVERQSKGKAVVIFALDASSSMRGEKVDCCKKAGMALAYKALNNRDMVGLIVFGSDIKMEIPPTTDFTLLAKSIASIKASKETNLVATFKKSVEIFPNEDVTKHLIILTDALPTKGESPEKDTIEGAIVAKSNNITLSVVGINLDEKGRKLAEKIVEIGGGRLYAVRNLKNIDKIVLEDYYYFQ